MIGAVRWMENNLCIGVIDTASSGDVANYTHGMVCTLVLNKYLQSASVVNVRLLNDYGIGYIDKLDDSLKQCSDKNIAVINMSFGSVHFLGKASIRKAINHYANKGIIIIAATSNDGYTTYPASLSNVISVAAGDRFGIDQDMQLQKGIDFIAPSDHEIALEGASFCFRKSNSYAAPYVTAMVGNLINEKGMLTIDEIRSTLAPEGTVYIYSPDWVEKAWISPEYMRKDAKFYFDVDERNLQQCMDDIDTLVLCTQSEMERYEDSEKHIVYLGSDDIRPAGNRHRFWNMEMRREQIRSSRGKADEIDIPVIWCIFYSETDIIKFLCGLKKMFADDGYNAFTGCPLVDSPLYDLEYLPCDLDLKDNLEDFIYWQTYYQQSDLVLIGTIYGEFGLQFLGDAIDMVVDFKHLDDYLLVGVYIDGYAPIENTYSLKDKNAIREIFHCIVKSFDKEEDE